LVYRLSGLFLLTAFLRRQRMSMCISLFPVAIPTNYASEFRELFEDTTYIIYLQLQYQQVSATELEERNACTVQKFVF